MATGGTKSTTLKQSSRTGASMKAQRELAAGSTAGSRCGSELWDGESPGKTRSLATVREASTMPRGSLAASQRGGAASVASQLRPGTFRILPETVKVKSTLCRSSSGVALLPHGSLVEVVEVVEDEEEGRLRGRITSPAAGWISLAKPSTGVVFAEPVEVTSESELDGDELSMATGGTASMSMSQGLPLQQPSEEERWARELVQGLAYGSSVLVPGVGVTSGGRASSADFAGGSQGVPLSAEMDLGASPRRSVLSRAQSGLQVARSVASQLWPGSYRVRTATAVKSNANRSSEDVGLLRQGDVVDVVEVVEDAEEGRVRGRITKPAGWISLRPQQGGEGLSEAAGDGAPEVARAGSRRAPEPEGRPESEVWDGGSEPAGPEGGRLSRAASPDRAGAPGPASRRNSTSPPKHFYIGSASASGLSLGGRASTSPPRAGTYRIVSEAAKVKSTVDRSGSFVASLRRGSLVEVVEVVEDPEEGRSAGAKRACKHTKSAGFLIFNLLEMSRPPFSIPLFALASQAAGAHRVARGLDLAGARMYFSSGDVKTWLE